MKLKHLSSYIGGAILVSLSHLAWADWQLEPYLFDAVYYADNNPDVEHADGYNKDMLAAHWKQNGIKEGRRSSPVFDVKYYLNHNADVQKQLGKHNYEKAAYHWYTSGHKEGRPSHPDFNAKAYLKNHPAIAREVGKHNYEAAIDNYLNYGYKKGLKGN